MIVSYLGQLILILGKVIVEITFDQFSLCSLFFFFSDLGKKYKFLILILGKLMIMIMVLEFSEEKVWILMMMTRMSNPKVSPFYLFLMMIMMIREFSNDFFFDLDDDDEDVDFDICPL
jgi:hypothetical protein